MAKRDYKNEIIPPEVSGFFWTVWKYVKVIFLAIWDVIVFFARLFVKILVGIYLLIKSIAFSASALIASVALMIIAVSLCVYLVSMGLGLKDSTKFVEWRDELIQEHRTFYETQKLRWAVKEPRAQDYSVAEVTDQSCNIDTDCTTPNEYLIRSVCPYSSKCLQNKCAVVCPEPFNHPGGRE